MKLSKLAFYVALALTVTACTTGNMSNDGTLQQAQQTYQSYDEITKQYQINEQWWQGYTDAELNRVVDLAIKNNLDLAKSGIAVNKALYNANLVGANLVPTFSGSGSVSAAKGLGSASSNNVSTGVSTTAAQAAFNLSYTVDLWRRLADTASAAEWTHKATIEDLKATRLSIINAVVTTYYQLAYYRDAIRITEESIRHYEQISRILTNKMNAGAIDSLAVDQAQQAVLNARNSVIDLKTNQKIAEQTLRNLLNVQPNTPLNIRYPNIMSVKLQGVDLNVPVSAIANRPDVVGSLQRLQSAFKTLTATEKSWFPTLTIGGSITGSATNIGNVADNPVGNGLIKLDLPFLDWNRVKNNVKISETDYVTARLNYEQKITSALNEIDRYYYSYTQSRSSLKILQDTNAKNKRISSYYKNRYEQGVSEFREWITALNTELNSQLAILNAKYAILTNENAVYQAMAGKYRR
ncbi:TPA: TolC family protein [Mannheimia haemolytica]|uniref:Cation efflux system protein CusC n=1 Tax=Mannheimia haemolytica TaxID=75985 RepID=A0A378NDB0_MANHA|nr:TolC family protein [Mannheimia haemolytica]AGQ39458.1 membrane protein [Mannheimia haemolytica D171]EEY10589.1 putative RND superfamily resistance-nodulation-cell division antiporter [Mannheimia haemolytica serotype A2 str. OVINE]EEY13832.1 putative RND superfamily resistance-nodulation-cell division antiporter [Mannheimia haemolytica serotype A2 str. BOVINE]KYL16897.1 membrane protein [Mannheimia haemolytica]KYL24247.1 membrane protein [Mannheimia haemolytica]